MKVSAKMPDLKRRRLFASVSSLIDHKRESSNIIYPPYNRDRSLFLRLCPECIDKPCVKACEEEIIFIDENGVPNLNFAERGCTFCDACADACNYDVLNDKTLTSINANVEINVLKCIAWQQVMCSSCKEPCLEDAIVFLGLFRPEIDQQKCTACGWCLSVCPSDAIEVTPI